MDLGPLMGAEKWGIPDNPASNSPSALTSSVVAPSAQGAAASKLYSPENPLFWFGALGVVTFGLMAFSTTVRVGKTSASLSIGDT